MSSPKNLTAEPAQFPFQAEHGSCSYTNITWYQTTWLDPPQHLLYKAQTRKLTSVFLTSGRCRSMSVTAGGRPTWTALTRGHPDLGFTLESVASWKPLDAVLIVVPLRSRSSQAKNTNKSCPNYHLQTIDPAMCHSDPGIRIEPCVLPIPVG